jgi:hypothetical protein
MARGSWTLLIGWLVVLFSDTLYDCGGVGGGLLFDQCQLCTAAFNPHATTRQRRVGRLMLGLRTLTGLIGSSLLWSGFDTVISKARAQFNNPWCK